MNHIKEYLKRKKALREAKRWLKANDADRFAARCLFHLNHKARATRYRHIKQHIYALKALVIGEFYRRGYCVAATKHLQTLSCWHSYEYNQGWEDECWKCGGDGIYAQHELYQFVFDIRGRTYVWHQPDSLVNFPVELTDQEVTKYSPGKRSEGSLIYTDLVILYQAVLYQYLKLAGDPTAKLPKLPSWKTVIRLQWYESVTRPLERKWYWDWQPRLRKISQYCENIHRLRAFVRTGEMPEPMILEEDEIPF